ncbi:3-deoxy-manno-octulosonate cytidylyltransferase [Serratia marcescens]|uniref:3-deoxy-manno-octulosonate cytidylyltransferase n=1 Tax=Serratia marcescens TaxID=615 RepID=UPI0040375787
MSVFPENRKVKIVIPARLSSSRLPEKALLMLQGHAVFWHVYRRCIEAGIEHQDIYLATDSDKIYKKAVDEGIQAIMTGSQHMSGTDRVSEVVELCHWPNDTLVVNVQGDEPLIPPRLIRELIDFSLKNKQFDIFSAYSKITNLEDAENNNMVKVAISERGNAVYFSRSRIPFNRDKPLDISSCVKHIGIYAYSANSLTAFCSLPTGTLESLEKLEQLRALENGMKIGMMYFDGDVHHGIDTVDDYNNIKRVIENEGN